MTPARWVAVMLGLTGVFLLSVAAGGLIARQLRGTPPPDVAVATPTPFATLLPTLGASPVPTGASLSPTPNATASPPLATPSPVPTLTATPPAALDPATVEEFTVELAAAIRDHDTDYLLARLHGATIDRYGSRQCRQYVATLPAADPQWEVLSAVPAEWIYESDGLQTVIPDAWTVSVRQPGADPRDLHFAPLDGTWRWFTDCGTHRT
jgi:hypothetical protein